MGSLRREPSELRFGVVRGTGGDAACSKITLGNLVKKRCAAVDHISTGIGVARSLWDRLVLDKRTQAARKTVLGQGSRSDRPRYHAHTRWAPPLPLALAAPSLTLTLTLDL